ncbi:MAG: sulfatase-like hydrolase/transferase [Flavobacteriaceae bacterium]
MKRKFPNYIKYILMNVIALFLFSFIFRLIFFFFFANFEDVTNKELINAFLYGIRFDLKLASLTFFPLAILVLIVNQKFFVKKIYRKIATTYLVLAYFTLTLFYLTDLGYYGYLSTRLDASSLRFLSNLKISSQFMFEEYPVFKGLFSLVILIILIRFLSVKFYKKIASTEQLIVSKKIKALYFISVFLLLSLSIYGSLNHYPLRWSQAYFSKNNTVNQFALNPVLNFFDSFAFRNEGVDEDKTRAYYPVIADYLNLSKDSIYFKREVVFDSGYTKKPNIAIIMLESLGAVPLGFNDNPAKGTPNIDSLINNSVYFDNFYVHKPNTAGSVFASITGLADVDDVKTASRNPRVIDQRIIFDQFKGYEKLYFIGGNANWANIRGVFQSNIERLKIYEESTYGSHVPRADVWGIDDYDLFKESDKVLSELHKEQKPFVAYIQTATNHRPFTVPDSKESFKPLKERDISNETLNKAGFISLAQLNALRYLDFNVKVFMRRAKEAGYYDNTIFAFFGDHNTSMNPTKEFKKEFDLAIQVHHVPFFIHAPKFIQPKRIQNEAKLADLFPTVANLAKANYINYTLGSNALDTLNKDSFGFVHLKIKGEPAVGLIQNGFYYSKTNISNTTNLYKLSDKETIDISQQYPKIAIKMDSLITSYYHSTKYLYYNNKKSNK